LNNLDEVVELVKGIEVYHDEYKKIGVAFDTWNKSKELAIIIGEKESELKKILKSKWKLSKWI